MFSPAVILHGAFASETPAACLRRAVEGQPVRLLTGLDEQTLGAELGRALLLLLPVDAGGFIPGPALAQALPRRDALAIVGVAREPGDFAGALAAGCQLVFTYDMMGDERLVPVLQGMIQRGVARLQNRAQIEEYRRFKASLTASPDAFIVFDENRKVFFVSDHYHRAYPRCADRMVRGIDVMEAFEMLCVDQGLRPPDPQYEAMKSFWNALEGQREFTMADGRIWRVTAARLAEGQGTIVTTTDVTLYRQQKAELERKSQELNEALENEREANALQHRFISMVSHEFRTPLSVIDGHAQVLLRRTESLTPEDISHRARTMRSAVSRLVAMMEGVLSSSMLETGHFRPSPETFDAAALLRELCEDHVELFGRKHVITFEGPGLPAQMRLDRKILTIVMTNLLSNAIKYGGDDPRIEVAARLRDGGLEVAVRDHGVGIPPGEMAHIFDRYYRASTAGEVAGTGIGLSLASDLLSLCGGSISASAAEGGGTKFVIYIPSVA